MNEFGMALWLPWDALLLYPNLAGDVETPITLPHAFHQPLLELLAAGWVISILGNVLVSKWGPC